MNLDDLLDKNKLQRRAVIREAECIGCTKCIQACPVDAIIGASKQMHTIIADVCIGCELCIPPCPVDCIDLIPRSAAEISDPPAFIQQSQSRHRQHEARLAQQAQQQHTTHQSSKLEHPTPLQTLAARQAAIQAAIERSRQKKSCSKLS